MITLEEIALEMLISTHHHPEGKQGLKCLMDLSLFCSELHIEHFQAVAYCIYRTDRRGLNPCRVLIFFNFS